MFMKTNKGFGTLAVLLIIVAVLAVGGVSYYSWKSKNVLPASKPENNLPQTNQAINNIPPAKIECHDSPNYFIITKNDYMDVGTDILVKYKTDINQKIPCNYIVEKTDYELKKYTCTSTDTTDCAHAQYFPV